MGKGVIFFVALIMVAAAVVNCTETANKNEASQRRREQAQLQKVLEEHSKIVGMGLTGRLASGYPGPAAASRRFPSVHAHVDGNKPCRYEGTC